MPPAFAFTSTGPAEALAVVARLLGVRVSPDALVHRFDRHPSPQSLKALVEIAPELGFTARGFRSDVAGLADAALPAIVHMVEPTTGNTGFGVLVACREGRFHLEDGKTGPPATLTSEEFASLWSGVVVTVEPREGATPSAELTGAGLSARLRNWYRADEPLSRAALVARWAAGASLAALCVASSIELGSALGSRVAGVAACLASALVAVGTSVSAILFAQSRRSVVPAGPSRLSSTVCGRGTFTDCLGVLASRYSRFAGIDWASVGMAFFSSTLLLIAAGAFVEDAQARLLWAWLAVAFVCALPESLALIAVQIWPLRRFCPLCMMIHAVVLVSAGLGIAYLAGTAGSFRPATVLPWAAAHLAAILGAFGLVVPYLAYTLEARTSRARLTWIGSTPLGALAEMAGRPRAVQAVPEAAVRIGSRSASIRLDALVHPLCTGCGPVVSQLAALASRHAGSVQVGLHFPPRDVMSRADRELCTALSALGLVTTGEEAVAAFVLVKDDPWPVLRDAERGAAVVVARLVPGAVVSPGILARAWSAVETADGIADQIERGTPTLLVQGRLWDGSVEDFDRLLSMQPRLVASILGISAESAAADPARA